MSDGPTEITRQRRVGYLLLGAAVAILIGSVIAFQYYGFPLVSYLGPFIPAGILVILGYRALAASRDRRTLQDERTVELHGKVGINAFLLLMSIIVVDMVIGMFPQDGNSTIYVFSGLFSYCLFFVYYKYVE